MEPDWMWGAILGAILGTIFTALVNWFGPIVSGYLRVINRRDKLLGSWISTYQSIYEHKGKWLCEEVVISLHRGKLRLKNSGNEGKYDYVAYGELVEDRQIVGKWTSQKAGADAYGYFMLTIAPLGNEMYGYWSGPTHSREQRYSRWILVRKKEDLDSTKGLLHDSEYDFRL